MTKDEALTMALAALLWADTEINEWRDEAHGYESKDHPVIMSAITVIKEALEQPEYRAVKTYHEGKPVYVAQEQEPLEYWNAVEGWVKIDEVRDHFDSVGCGTIYKTGGEDRTPLYTAPPQRKPLTVDEVWANDQLMSINAELGCSMDLLMEVARAIEAAHGIKE